MRFTLPALLFSALTSPFLTSLETYPQYVLNVLWAQDTQTGVSIADQLALEASTLTPLLKRL